jgi:PleD family two-component response regulator
VPLSLAMLDIESLQENQRHLRACPKSANRVILCVAQWITAAVRHTDLVARYGGEEFVRHPGRCGPDGPHEKRFPERAAADCGTQLRVSSRPRGRPRTVRFTMSCGVAQFAPVESAQQLVASGRTRRMYDAKKSRTQSRGRPAPVDAQRNLRVALLSYFVPVSAV